MTRNRSVSALLVTTSHVTSKAFEYYTAPISFVKEVVQGTTPQSPYF